VEISTHKISTFSINRRLILLLILEDVNIPVKEIYQQKYSKSERLAVYIM
jgi:hypothetical protein